MPVDGDHGHPDEHRGERPRDSFVECRAPPPADSQQAFPLFPNYGRWLWWPGILLASFAPEADKERDDDNQRDKRSGRESSAAQQIEGGERESRQQEPDVQRSTEAFAHQLDSTVGGLVEQVKEHLLPRIYPVKG